MSVQYNVDQQRFQTSPPAKAFELNTKVQFHGRNQSHITYKCCQRWTMLEESPRSGLAILEVTVPTGYIVQQQHLDAYVQWLGLEANRDHQSNLRPIGRGHQPKELHTHRLQRARYTDTKVYFYFDYVSTFILPDSKVKGCFLSPVLLLQFTLILHLNQFLLSLFFYSILTMVSKFFKLISTKYTLLS